MGILDDAIREHIDLKRKHGARDSEISEIEDEALGSGERPDPFAAGELFGGVSSAGAAAPEVSEQEMGPATPPPDGPATPPPGGPPTPPPDGLAEPPAAEEPTALVEPPAPPPEPPAAAPPEPSFPEPPPAEPSLPERPSAPEPPLESESLEDLVAEEEASGPPETSDVAVPPPPPPETEPARPEPPTPPPPAATEGQRGRARGRADVPTQEHIPPRPTGDAAPVPSEPELSEEGGPQLFDFETDSGLLEAEGADLGAPPAPAADSDDFEALGPVDEGEEAENRYRDEEEPYREQRGGTTDFEEVEEVEEVYETEVRPAAPAQEEEQERFRTEERPAGPDDDEDDEDDLLSGSPEFLDKDTDESLWFEKGPPKDFDFEDEDEDEK